MDRDHINRCQMRLADEERRASEAACPEAAELHRQLASLYKTQIAVAERNWLSIFDPGSQNRA